MAKHRRLTLSLTTQLARTELQRCRILFGIRQHRRDAIVDRGPKSLIARMNSPLQRLAIWDDLRHRASARLVWKRMYSSREDALHDAGGGTGTRLNDLQRDINDLQREINRLQIKRIGLAVDQSREQDVHKIDKLLDGHQAVLKQLQQQRAQEQEQQSIEDLRRAREQEQKWARKAIENLQTDVAKTETKLQGLEAKFAALNPVSQDYTHEVGLLRADIAEATRQLNEKRRELRFKEEQWVLRENVAMAETKLQGLEAKLAALDPVSQDNTHEVGLLRAGTAEATRQLNEKRRELHFKEEQWVLTEDVAKAEAEVVDLRARQASAKERGDKEGFKQISNELLAAQKKVDMAQQALRASRARSTNSLVVKPALNHVWSHMPDMEQIAKTPLGTLVYRLPTGVKLLSVAKNADLGRNDHLVVRRSGQLVGELVLDGLRDPAKPRQFILTGNPGTGKSVLRNYLMKLCWDNGFHVIDKATHIDSPAYILRPGHEAEVVARSVFEALGMLESEGVPASNILYMCDTVGDRSQEPEPNLDCATVLTASPNVQHYKQFQKENGRLLVWPTWSLEELLDAREYLFTEDMTEQVLRERFGIVGGVVRQICSQEKYTRQRRAVSLAIKTLTLEHLVHFAANVNLHRAIDSMSHKLYQLQPVDPMKPSHCLTDGSSTECLLGESAVALPISRTVEEALLAQIPKADMTIAWRHWYGILGVAGLYSHGSAGDQFEALFFRLSSGGKLPLMHVNEIGATKEPSSKAVQKMTRQPHLLSGNAEDGPYQPHVLYQAVKGTGAIDGWMFEETEDGRRVLWLLQMTVGGTHDIKIGPLVFAIKALRQNEWADAEVRLAFVVPWWREDAYLRAGGQRYTGVGGAGIKEQHWEESATSDTGSMYYSPGTKRKWVRARPQAEWTDANGLTAAPFTLDEAMETVVGSECGVTQWVWSCCVDSGANAGESRSLEDRVDSSDNVTDEEASDDEMDELDK